MSTTASSRRQDRPGALGRAMHAAVIALTRTGVSVWGTRLLHVRGRTTGQWRVAVVNLLTHDGHRYLVAPRGQTQWVRNLRQAGEGELRLGRRVERFVAAELPDDEKPAVLRAYLRRWEFEVASYFDGVGPQAPAEELRRIAGSHPVFRITERNLC